MLSIQSGFSFTSGLVFIYKRPFLKGHKQSKSHNLPKISVNNCCSVILRNIIQQPSYEFVHCWYVMRFASFVLFSPPFCLTPNVVSCRRKNYSIQTDTENFNVQHQLDEVKSSQKAPVTKFFDNLIFTEFKCSLRAPKFALNYAVFLKVEKRRTPKLLVSLRMGMTKNLRIYLVYQSLPGQRHRYQRCGSSRVFRSLHGRSPEKKKWW